MKKNTIANQFKKDKSISLKIDQGNINANKKNTISKEENDNEITLKKEDLISKLKRENLLLQEQNTELLSKLDLSQKKISELESLISQLRLQLNEANKKIELNNINKEKKEKIEEKGRILKCNLINLQSNFVLRKIFNNLKRKKFLEIIKTNKKVQKRLEIELKDYKEYNEKYSDIEIEILPALRRYGKFINIDDNEKNEASYFLYSYF